MPYIPDPYNQAAPTDTETASTAAAEFRALKLHLQQHVMMEAESAIDPSTQSFDAFITPATHRVSAAGSALSGGNAPNGALSGTGSLAVFASAAGCIQVFMATAASTPVMQIRFYSSVGTSWSSWVPVGSATATDLISALGYTPANITGANATVDSNWPILAKGVHLASSNGYGSRNVSTAAPSGGANGDLWLQV